MVFLAQCAMFYKNDRAVSRYSESWMLFVIIFTGWHFLGQVEASCSCFTCTMPRIHCAPTRCPLVHIVNSCSPTCELSMVSGIRLPLSPAGGNFHISNIDYYPKQSTIRRLNLSATPLSSTGTYYDLGTGVPGSEEPQIVSPKTSVMIWEEQRLFSWLIWMTTIYK